MLHVKFDRKSDAVVQTQHGSTPHAGRTVPNRSIHEEVRKTGYEVTGGHCVRACARALVAKSPQIRANPIPTTATSKTSSSSGAGGIGWTA